jgi:hypothetical protein
VAVGKSPQMAADCLYPYRVGVCGVRNGLTVGLPNGFVSYSKCWLSPWGSPGFLATINEPMSLFQRSPGVAPSRPGRVKSTTPAKTFAATLPHRHDATHMKPRHGLPQQYPRPPGGIKEGDNPLLSMPCYPITADTITGDNALPAATGATALGQPTIVANATIK